jgi:hypothetical protein
MLMSETSPIRNMAAVRKPRATGRVKKSDKALMVGFLERVGRVEWSLLVEERVSQEAVEKAKVKAFRKRAWFARELLQSLFFGNKIWQDNAGERHGEVIAKPSGHKGGPGNMQHLLFHPASGGPGLLNREMNSRESTISGPLFESCLPEHLLRMARCVEKWEYGFS